MPVIGQSRPHPLLLRGAEHRRRRARRLALHRRRDPLLHAARAARGRASAIGENTNWAVEQPRRPMVVRARDRGGRRGRDRVDDDLARPEVGREAPQPRHRVVPPPRRQDRRGPRLPPRRQEEPARETCSASTTPAAATRRSRTGSRRPVVLSERDRHQGQRRAGAAAAVHRGARGAARDGAAASSARRSPPTSTSGRRRASSRASSSPAAASSASSASSSPRSYGGQGGTHLHDAVWVEELSRSGGSGGVAAGLNAHASIAMPPIFNFGTEEQRQRWIVPGIRGEKIGALGITEPGAGSDVAGIRTFAAQGARRLRRQRLEDLHHQRRPRRLPRLRRARPPRRAATAASPSSSWSARCPATR